MENKILVETSARHVHLTAEHIEILFGKGATLTHKKDLSQPGQFACEERVTVEGPKALSRTLSFSVPQDLSLRLRYPLPTLVHSELLLPFVSRVTLQAVQAVSLSALQVRLSLQRVLSPLSVTSTLLPSMQRLQASQIRR